MDFAKRIKAFEEKALLAIDKSMCKAFDSLGKESVALTQNINLGGYSDGDIANNWHMSVGAVNMVIPNGPDISGSASLARLSLFVTSKPFYKKDSVVFLTNVMNYSYRANFIGWPRGPGTNGWTWTKNIQPYGFVGKAINNLKGRYM